MIFSMITGDMFTFAIIYVIVLFGFSQAYYFLYKGHENVDETPYGTYFSTWMGELSSKQQQPSISSQQESLIMLCFHFVGLFQTTLGDYDVSASKLTAPIDLLPIY